MINNPMITVPTGSRRTRPDPVVLAKQDGDAEPDPVVRLRLTEAVPLAHALVAAVAAEAGIATLAIKGPVLSAYGLRHARPSADADILVAPDRIHDLVDRLAAYGWRERYERPIARILDDHSVTLTHHDWPCDVDLHWYFPGLLADPDDAFDFLWAGRSTIELAHRPVPVPARSDTVAIAALHALRHPDSSRHRADLEDLVDRIKADWQPADTIRMSALVGRCGAAVTLAPFLSAVDVASAAEGSRPDRLRAWRAYTGTHDHGSTGAWLYVIRRATWRDRPRLLVRALYPTRSELVAEHGPIGRRRRWELRGRRWWRACRALPQAVGVLLRTGRRT